MKRDDPTPPRMDGIEAGRRDHEYLSQSTRWAARRGEPSPRAAMMGTDWDRTADPPHCRRLMAFRYAGGGRMVFLWKRIRWRRWQPRAYRRGPDGAWRRTAC